MSYSMVRAGKLIERLESQGESYSTSLSSRGLAPRAHEVYHLHAHHRFAFLVQDFDMGADDAAVGTSRYGPWRICHVRRVTRTFQKYSCRRMLAR